MRVLVVSPYAVMNATYETDLEVVQDHLDAGDDVTMLACDASLSFCQPNPSHDLRLCIQCISRRHVGLGSLSRRIEVRPLLRLRRADREEISRLPTSFANMDELGGLRMEEFDLGWSVVSSVISITVEPDPDFTSPAVADLARRCITSAAAVFRSVQHYIDEIKPDRVYVFSGRFANTRAVLRAAESRGVDFYLTERGSSFNHYMLFKNRLSHDPDFFQGLIREYWERSDAEERAVLGATFYIEVARGVHYAYHSYVTKQKPDELPEGFDPAKNNVAIFTSSDFEFAAVRDILKNPVYRDQYDGLDQVVRSANADPNLHLWIRMHPSASTKPSVVERMLRLNTGQTVVIPPRSSVSTYALMRAATRVLTFGSTTGIEAVYWGKPSILGNRSYYDRLGGTYNPGSHEELMGLLRQEGLPPKDREASLVYGYFTRAHGYRFHHFQPLGLGGGPFRGVSVAPSVAARIAARVVAPLSQRAGRVHLRLLERGLAH